MRRRTVLATLSAIAICAAGVVGTTPARAESVGATNTVYCADGSGAPCAANPAGDGLRTPDVITTSATNAVAAWRTGIYSGTVDQGDIQYSYTTNGGTSWSTPQYLIQSNSTYHYGYVIFGQVSGGYLYAFLGRAPASSSNGFPTTMIEKESTDAGHTWHDVTISTPASVGEIVVAGRPVKYGSTYILSFWNHDGAGLPRSGALISTDMINWTFGGWVPDPAGKQMGEPQLVISQDDPSTLLMVGRPEYASTIYDSGPAYSVTSTSINGGTTWTNATDDTALPDYNTKSFFAKDANGQYVDIYNTYGSGFGTAMPALFRDVLYYKVKKPGRPWGAGQFMADEAPRGTRPQKNWDTYPMGSEYAPGKYFVIWESSTEAINVAKVDLSDAFTGTNQTWTTLNNWTALPGGGTAAIAAGKLHLNNANSGVTGVTQTPAPSGAFVATVTGSVNSYSTLNTTTGVGTSLGLKVATGSKRLMLTVQADGVYSMIDGATTWSRVYTATNDNASHVWRVTVNADGHASLYKDGGETGAAWTIQSNAATPEILQWVSGTAAEPADATIASTTVVRGIDSTDWNSLTGWTVVGTASISPASQLDVKNSNSGTSSVTGSVVPSCDPTVELQGHVDSYGTINTTTGIGVDLGIEVGNGAKRLMVTFQNDGVYAIVKGSTTWSNVYPMTGTGTQGTWKITTGSAGEAHLYRNGVDTGATWTVQDRKDQRQIMVFASGTAAQPVESHLDWLHVTCTNN
jgi:hypothetical protein